MTSLWSEYNYSFYQTDPLKCQIEVKKPGNTGSAVVDSFKKCLNDPLKPDKEAKLAPDNAKAD